MAHPLHPMANPYTRGSHLGGMRPYANPYTRGSHLGGMHPYANPYASHPYTAHPYSSSLLNPSVLAHPPILAHGAQGLHHHHHPLAPYTMRHPYTGGAVDPLVTVHPNGYAHGHHHHLGLSSPYHSPLTHTALYPAKAPHTKQELEILNARVEAEKITSKARQDLIVANASSQAMCKKNHELDALKKSTDEKVASIQKKAQETIDKKHAEIAKKLEAKQHAEEKAAEKAAEEKKEAQAKAEEAAKEKTQNP